MDVTTELIANPPVASGDQPASEDHPDSSLLASKFAIPAAPPFMVSRPALLARVTEAVRGPVTLVTGLPGSGKTQLLASWVRNRVVDWPIAWITLEDGDEHASTFWTYVMEGLRRAGVPVPLLTPAAPGAAVSRPTLGRLAAAIEEHPSPVVLVLDGVSQLPGRDWADGLDFLLTHTPKLRLVLTGRWDPPLPLYRYRLAGELQALRTADLAFTAAEAGRLMELHGVMLGKRELDALLEHTEGWAAGIRFCACVLQGSGDAERLVSTISGGESTIAEYFIGEVLRLQSPLVRQFLLETSVLDTFTPELAAAVTERPDAHRMLATLSRENAFIQPVAEGSDVYRYHRLFAELLRAQLAWTEPEQVAVLHARAAEWLAENGELVEAVGHAIRAGDWSRAAAMLIEGYAVGRLLIEGSAGRLGGLFAEMPDHLEHAEAVMIRAALAYGDGRPAHAAEQLAYAGDLLSAGGSDSADGLTLTCFVLQILLLADGTDAAQVGELLPVVDAFLGITPKHLLARHPELRALRLAAEGRALSGTGAVDAAADVLGAAAAAVPIGSESLKISCLGHLALIEAYRGHLSRAESAALQALDLAGQCGLRGLDLGRWPAAAEVALAWVALERYDIDAADRHLRAAQPLCQSDADALPAAAYALVRARRLQTRGDVRTAMDVLRAGVESGLTPPTWLGREIVLSRVGMSIAVGHPDEPAVESFDRFPDPHAPEVEVVRAALLLLRGERRQAHEIARTVADAAGVSVPVSLDAWLLLATIAASQDDAPGAREAVRRAMRVAGPESYRRPFHQVWGGLRRVLRDDERLILGNRPLGTEPTPSRLAPADPARTDPANAEPMIVEALSKRELDVLRGMAEMLPTEEIAATMYISVNTVKTHVRSILRKLSASRRNEAVRRARALNLI
ncbi:LuxR C-terminal-related transcriptional regulator [Cryptosporangium minutisporangium]|uniref:LuxR family transcriptional regulator n=1 Tax=Cryptosporangium minutisporangium TaxID=113569 RepID=A0ABP6SS48_9ACTN